MKTRIDQDELWPLYTLDERWGQECEVPDELVARYEKAMAEFWEVQSALGAIYVEG